MINIAYVIDTIKTPGAGTEKQLLMLLHGLDRTEFTPFLVCLHTSDWLQSQRFPFDVEVYDVRRSISIGHARAVSRFRALCLERKIDVVQTFFVDANKFAIVGTHLARTATTVASRRNVGHSHSRLNLAALRFLRRWTDRYLANSQAAADRTVELEHVVPDKIDIIHNGLDLGRFRAITPAMRAEQRRQWQIEDNDIVVGIVANLRDVKNIDSLIRVAARLVPEFPRLQFVSVGEGPDRTRLQSLIGSLKLGARFQLTGRQSDVVPSLAGFDIAVLCSSFESLSNSLIEYMAAGLPIVASAVGGNIEAIRHEDNGLVYPVREDDMLEAGLRRLLGDEALAARLASRARQDAETKYSREACIENHQIYYEQLVRKNR